MITIDPFAADGYSVSELTDAINILPNQYNRIERERIFNEKGVSTRSIMVEEKNGVLTLLTSKPVGSPGDQNKTGKRTVRTFTIPHFPLDDVILPDEYVGLRAFGSMTEMEQLNTIINDHLQTMKNKHDITREFLKMCAIKGVILDGDGSTIYNLFTEFGITQKTVDFALDTDTTEVLAKCFEVLRHMEDNLLGEVMTGCACWTDSTFFDALVTHPVVEDAYKYHSEASNRLGGDTRRWFTFGGITFSEYRASVANAAGSTTSFIGAGEAYCFPLGTMDTFTIYDAPADFLETANTIGRPYYAKMEPRKFNRGLDMHTQTNPLPLCKRPGLLVKLSK